MCFSDASSIAAGAYSVSSKDHIVKLGCLGSGQRTKHKKFYIQKIKAVLLAFNSFSDKLNNKNVKWFTDSHICARILQSGSYKEDLHSLSCQMYSVYASKGISLDIHWIHRSQNCEADFISTVVRQSIMMSGAFQIIIFFFLHLWIPCGPGPCGGLTILTDLPIMRVGKLKRLTQ